MAAFGLVAKEYASVRGVAMEPSAVGMTPTFTLFKDAQLMRRTRCEAPKGNGSTRRGHAKLGGKSWYGARHTLCGSAMTLANTMST